MQIVYRLFVLALLCWLTACQSSSDDRPLFEFVAPAQSGVDFSNDISYRDSLIALSFEYLFNGSGVAVGDINQDGLSDLFFTGNMVPCRLYLNKGNFQFEDITQSAGIETDGKWASGASLVDINDDGHLDIYICMGGHSKEAGKRNNLLYINKGDNTFTEQAEAYGLADEGYSIHAAFFDYDRDNDLDLYLLTTELDPYNWTEFKARRLKGEASNTDRLYRNNGDGTFSNVSAEAGVLIEGYGLGVGVWDVNEDDWPDLYVANDFLSNDIIYINNGDGTFTDRIGDYLNHTSRNGMGTDLQDFNNDGHTDVMVLDMLPKSNRRQKSMFGFFNYDKFRLGVESGYQPQYARNTLQMNRGPVGPDGDIGFSEVGQLAGISQTDWSWSALFADFDNDGWQDLYITNGYRQDITHMDFATYSRQVAASPFGTEEAKRTQMLQRLKELPELKQPNFMYRNTGSLPFEDCSGKWGFREDSYSNGAAYADLDNDGDLDLVVNNIDQPAFLYRNQLQQRDSLSNHLRIRLQGPAGNRHGLGAKLRLRAGGQNQYRYHSPYRGYLSTVEGELHFGMGAVGTAEEVEVTWPDGRRQLLTNVASNQLLELKHEEASAQPLNQNPQASSWWREVAEEKGLVYEHREKDFVDFKIQAILPHKHSQNGPGIAVGDIDGDGLDDCFIGGSAGFVGQFFIQQQDGTFRTRKADMEAGYEDMGSLLLDVDGDGDQDLFVVSGGSSFQPTAPLYQDRLYLNDGQGNFERAPDALPEMRSSGAAIAAVDYDKDGDLDVFVGGRVQPGSYPLSPRSYLLRNESEGGVVRFRDVTEQLMPEAVEGGMICDALWSDYDQDGWMDLLVVGEWMPLTIYRNAEGTFRAITPSNGLEHSKGWWNSITAVDMDQDGDMDYLAGNLGLNSRYLASPDEPVCVYAKDYDKNGRIDPVLCHYIEGKNYIAHSRDMLIEQINSMKGRFKTYDAYGATTFERSFTPEELKDAQILKSETFASSYFENKGNGQFERRDLPMEAQVAPIFGILPGDFNADGLPDALLVGNSYSTEIGIGQYDACKGVVLLGDGKGGFESAPLEETGFWVDKDAKSLALLLGADQQALLLAGRNNDRTRVFASNRSHSNGQYVPLQPGEQHAIVGWQDGRTQRFEFPHGSTYLSQSSRCVQLPKDAKSVRIYKDKVDPTVA
ncbi:MAG: VCBS repeat-containing protein, partial [Bacteroidota bacterium]